MYWVWNRACACFVKLLSSWWVFKSYVKTWKSGTTWAAPAIPVPAALKPSEAVTYNYVFASSVSGKCPVNWNTILGTWKQISSCKLAWYVLPRYESLVMYMYMHNYAVWLGRAWASPTLALLHCTPRVCPVDLAITVNFKSANFTCTCTIIFKLDEPSSYCLTNDGDNKDGDHSWTLARAPWTFFLLGDTDKDGDSVWTYMYCHGWWRCC